VRPYHPGTRSRPASLPLCPYRRRPAPPVRESFFKILNGLRVLFRVLRPGADVSKTEFFEHAANRHFIEIDAKPLLDDAPEVNAPPPHDPVLDWIGRGFHDPLQLLFLFRRQFRARPGSFAVDQPCWTVGMEAMNPIAQRLSIHRATPVRHHWIRYAP
jgi:hypothetical protein